MKTVVIVGGGLAGLSAALLLNKYGFEVTVVEKKGYPLNKVCGEYVSNEVLPYLHSLGICIDVLNPSHLTKLSLTSVSGSKVSVGLDMGGFGLSRFKFDKLLYDKAVTNGVKFLTHVKVNEISMDVNQFCIKLSDNTMLSADVAIAAYGKRSVLDKMFKRPFFSARSPYLGVKYHVKTDFPQDVVQLDNFDGGYCGICKIEGEKYNLCYLVKNQRLKDHGSISDMEKSVLFQNPHLKRLFTESEFLFEKPEVINEISFSRKSLVEEHVLFCGDAAGMITPLCGNGMAMAIHSGKIVAETIFRHIQEDANLSKRTILEENYKRSWNSQFGMRLSTGRFIQNLFLQPGMSSLGISTFKVLPGLLQLVVKKTHGRPF
ncbi:MAG TPA: FAD-dependent oxidoreductase [Sphingobacteriaceae bacterium]